MTNDQHMTNGDLVKGGAGAATAFASVIMSALPEIEVWLRLASLTVGLLVGLVTLYSLVKKLRSKKGNHHGKN